MKKIEKEILLTIDIGNTLAKTGLFINGSLKSFFSLNYNEIPKYIEKIAASGKKNQINIIISSVIPKITSFVLDKIRRIKANIAISVAGRDIPITLKHKYKNYAALGLDRKVNAYGAIKIYGSPIIVVDLGTAITFDYIDKNEIFQGGLIIPGPQTALSALGEKTALLPRIALSGKNSSAMLGRDTKSCMTSGILQGFGAMLDELIERYRTRYGKNILTIATGGLSEAVFPYTKKINLLDKEHSARSLYLIWKNR